jgi:hypothetical protein
MIKQFNPFMQFRTTGQRLRQHLEGSLSIATICRCLPPMSTGREKARNSGHRSFLATPVPSCRTWKEPTDRIRELQDHCETLENALAQIAAVTFDPKQTLPAVQATDCEDPACRAGAGTEAGVSRLPGLTIAADSAMLK